MDKQTFVSHVEALLPNYKTNQNVKKQLARVQLLGLVGPSGAGKSTIMHQSGIPSVIGDTTRSLREGEVQGLDYNFRSDFDAMLKEIEDGEYVQIVVQRSSEVYGTKISSFPASGPCTMAVIASAVPSFQQLGFGAFRPIYIVPPSYSEWMRRIATHHDKDVEARLGEAKQSLFTALQDPSFVFLLNDSLDDAITTLRNIAAGDIDQAASAQARATANTLYEHLQNSIS